MVAGTVRRLDRGHVRDVPGPDGMSTYHLAGPDDTSAPFIGYPTGCDATRCAWCYVGGSHTVAAHAAAVAVAVAAAT